MSNPAPHTFLAPHTFFAGEMVEVLSAGRIAATLDATGMLDGVPFMPEMLAFCGQRMRVHRRADKTCVEGHYGLRKLGGTVLLEAARCDGAAHDGCQRNCMMFWKEAWLRPAGEAAPALDLLTEARARKRLAAIATRDGDRYACQSTALMAATQPQAAWNIAHLITDVRRGELSLTGFAAMVGRTLVNRLRGLVGLADLGALAGASGKAAPGDLNLRPGEWVRVLPAETIRATLGPDGYNRGLSFEPEMSRYIGGVYQVEFAVQKIILEETGKMARLNRTVALKTLACAGVCAKNCPRANTLYWREAWLERVDVRAIAAE
jgi:hypothetical protein